MKKTVSVLLALALLCFAASCSSAQNGDEQGASVQPEVTVSEETVSDASSVTEISLPAESVPVSEPEESAVSESSADESAPVEESSEAPSVAPSHGSGNSLQDIRAAASGYLCAVLTIPIEYCSTVAEVQEAIAASDLAKEYPFLLKIPKERILSLGGYDLYCIIPIKAETKLSVRPYGYDPGTDEYILGMPMYQGSGEPILLHCNTSDIESNNMVVLNADTDKECSFSLYISMRDGSTCAPKEYIYLVNNRPTFDD